MKNLAEIKKLHQARHFAEAKKGYLAILAKNPKEIEVLHSLGILCVQQENLSEAIQYFERRSKSGG